MTQPAAERAALTTRGQYQPHLGRGGSYSTAGYVLYLANLADLR